MTLAVTTQRDGGPPLSTPPRVDLHGKPDAAGNPNAREGGPGRESSHTGAPSDADSLSRRPNRMPLYTVWAPSAGRAGHLVAIANNADTGSEPACRSYVHTVRRSPVRLRVGPTHPVQRSCTAPAISGTGSGSSSAIFSSTSIVIQAADRVARHTTRPRHELKPRPLCRCARRDCWQSLA